MQSHYNPASQKINIIVPQDLVAFIGFYIEDRQLNTIMAQKFRVLQMRLSKFEKHRGFKITFNAINLQFATELSTFYRNTQEYNLNTIRRDFGYISTLCSYAARKNINVTPDVVDFKIGKVIKTGMFTDHNDDVISTNNKTYYPYFTLKEIEVFEKLEDLSESLENVRDWFLVGCYTGQRISDFLNFDKSKIIESKGRKFLKFSQQKTKNRMLLPMSDKLRTVLDKRGGDFPRKIADQKFNDYIKKVAKEAGFTEKILGGKNIVVEGKGKRKVHGEYERWELISSHCCRRSFATNYYKIIPTYDLMYLTGHKTESEFLKYLNEEPEERAHYIAETYGNIL